MRCVDSLLAVVLSCFASAVRAEDWPQWMGPNRDDQWTESGIIDAFPAEGPTVLWRAPIAGGYSGPAVAGGKVFVTDFALENGEVKNDPGGRVELKGQERVLSFDAETGQPLWQYAYLCEYKISYPAGPRATPTVADGKVYTLGAEGHLACLDAQTGELAWSKELKQEYKIESPIWGFCGHPLVDGQKLICLVGGEGSVAVAFDKDTGRELWRALSASEPGYCPPTIIEAGGVRQLLIWHAQSLNSLNPATGEVYWSLPLEPGYGMAIARPMQAGDYLFASGIGEVCAVFKLDREKPAAEEVWRGTKENSLYCSNSTPLITDGIIYGSDCGKGTFRAVRLEDGERLWETFAPTTGGERRAGHGTAFVTQNGDRYFLFSETGDLIIARLTPEKYEEVSRTHLIDPTNEAFGRTVVWTHPAFANRCVYARNDKELVCVSLAKE
ncbi:MAG: PQQ-binding-like beta-propeller repeat protein [Planctomycetia bacterium]|nr:PQQ-binding-like beta-propeller repeat protein [Planctomycetia bacterium]